MKHSETINELAAALAKAQPEFEAAGRDHKAKVETKTGGYYEFNYADFAAYLDVCRKPLGANGLSFVQEATRQEDQVSVTTLLMHTSGQWIETDPLTLPLIADSRGALTAQIIGSGVTYAKRYSLSSLIGLASEADDDGNQASGNSAETSRRPAAPDCPKCGNNTHVIKGKEEYGGGWLCWKNKGGCGEKWQDAPANPDPPPPEPEKKPAKKIDAAAFDHSKFVDAIFAATDTAAIKKIVEGLDKKPMPIPDKQVPYREAFKRLLQLDNPDLAWAETKLTALRQTTCLDDVTFTELINAVEARQQPA